MFENESEDSNDENNWRNDYPDELDDDDEVDMRRAMDDFNLGWCQISQHKASSCIQ